MNYKVSEVVDCLNSWAKDEYELSWDNSGIQTYFDETLKNVFIAMDLDDIVLSEAIEQDCNFIITHHPLLFSPIKRIVEGHYKSDLIIKVIEQKISVYSAHTTLDIAQNGVNQALAEALNLKNIQDFVKLEHDFYIGKYGEIVSVETEKFIKTIRENLGIFDINLMGKKRDYIKKIALVGGAGADYIQEAKDLDIDLYITGDVKYHDGQKAYENDIMLLDIGHYDSEKFVFGKVESFIRKNFSEVKTYIQRENNFKISI